MSQHSDEVSKYSERNDGLHIRSEMYLTFRVCYVEYFVSEKCTKSHTERLAKMEIVNETLSRNIRKETIPTRSSKTLNNQLGRVVSLSPGEMSTGTSKYPVLFRSSEVAQK